MTNKKSIKETITQNRVDFEHMSASLVRNGKQLSPQRSRSRAEPTAHTSNMRESHSDWFIPAGSLGRRAGLPHRPLVVSIRMAWGSTDRHDSVMSYCGYKLS